MINLGVNMRVLYVQLRSSLMAGCGTVCRWSNVAGADAADRKLPANAVGAAWNANVKQAAPNSAVAGATFSDQQIAVINEISAYFMKLDNVKGRFVQTGAKKKRMRGKFMIKRPGRFRFNYNRPSRMVILSDGAISISRTTI